MIEALLFVGALGGMVLLLWGVVRSTGRDVPRLGVFSYGDSRQHMPEGAIKPRRHGPAGGGDA